jgi:hypothetical protein
VEVGAKIQEAILVKALPKLMHSISILVRVQQRVNAKSDKLMKDLAGLLVSIHRLGGLTKFVDMADWISSLSGKLIQEALVCMSHDDYELVDTIAYADGFLKSMVTD